MASVDTSIARVTPAATPTATGTTASFTPAVGDLLVLCASYDNSAVTPTASDTTGGTWTLQALSDGSVDTPLGSSISAVFTCPVTTATARTVTSGDAGAFFQSLKVYRVTPAAGASLSVGATGHAGNASANMTPTAFTSTASGSLLFAAAASLTGTSIAASSDLTADAFFNATLDDLTPISGFKTLGAPGGQTFNANATITTPAWHWGAVEVVETAANTPGGPLSTTRPAAFSRGPMGLGLPTFANPLAGGSTIPPPVIPNPNAVPAFGTSLPRRRLHWPPRRRPVQQFIPSQVRDLTPPLRVLGFSQSVLAAGASKTVPTPSGTLNAEWLVAFQIQDELGVLTDMTAPSGWTLIASQQSGGGLCMKTWHKSVNANEDNYSTWGMTTAATNRVTVVRLGGRKYGGALIVYGGMISGTGSVTDHTAPGFALSGSDGDDIMVIASWTGITGASNTWTQPAGYTALGALTDNVHHSNTLGWSGRLPPIAGGYPAQHGTSSIATTGDINGIVIVTQNLAMPQRHPARRTAPSTVPPVLARRRQVLPPQGQSAALAPTFVPAMPPRRALARMARRSRYWPGPADDDLQDLSPSVTARRRIGRAMAKAVRRRGDFNPPFLQAAPVAPTYVPAAPPRRRLAALLRRRPVVGPADDDLQDLPVTSTPMLRRRAPGRRQPTSTTPVPAQAAAPATIWRPVVVSVRRLGRVLRRPAAATPVPTQAVPVVPAWVPQRTAARRVLAGLRRQRGDGAPLPEQPFAPTRASRWVRPARTVRSSTVQPVRIQAAPPAPAYPPAPVSPRRWGRVLRRPGSVTPVPAQQAAPVAPAYVPGRSLPRRVAALVRRQRGDTTPPLDQAAAPTSSARRARAGWRHPVRTVTPVPSQVAPVAPAWVPGVAAGRRVARAVRRGRAVSPFTQAAPVAPAWVPLVPVLRRLGRPRRGQAVTPVPLQVPVAPLFIPAAVGPKRLRGLWRRRSAAVAPTSVQDAPGRPAPQRHPVAPASRTRRGAMPPIPQATPPAPLDVRRFGPSRVRRARVVQPARPQDVVPAPALRPSSPRRVLAAVRGLRRLTPRWVGAARTAVAVDVRVSGPAGTGATTGPDITGATAGGPSSTSGTTGAGIAGASSGPSSLTGNVT